jgi:hypothetical protein
MDIEDRKHVVWARHWCLDVGRYASEERVAGRLKRHEEFKLSDASHDANSQT